MSEIESDYYRFMRFDPEHSRGGLAHYVPLFAGTGPVLELACGRGEFLELLGEAGIEAAGVDSDAGMVAVARERGLAVHEGDALAYVAERPAGTYEGVFAAHFLEHLAPDAVASLLTDVHRVLRPGGRFVAVVPNAACYAVLTHDFWRDPTHVRFYDPDLVAFLCTRAGFTVEQTAGNPRNHPGPPPGIRAGTDPHVDPPLSDEIRDAAERARAVLRRKPEPDADLGYALGHLLDVVSERLRATQERLAVTQRAYEHLVATLWQPNEVYVVARA